MSKATATSKKAISQNELRRIMSEQKKKLPQTVKKIESPLAKYSGSGELRCILCDSPVRSEALWGTHLASKEHLANIAAAKRAKATKLEPPVSCFKRPAPSPAPPPQPSKKPKGILKNADQGVPMDFFDSKKVKSEPNVQVKTEPGVKNVPQKLRLADYGSDEEEDMKPSVPVVPPFRLRQTEPKEAEEKSKKSTGEDSDTLPEGFFDDPKLDAKVRNVEYKDPVEEEWERFQRAIKEEAEQSQQIIQDEQEEATAERQLEEIDEQMRNWSRVLELERRKDQVKVEPTSEFGHTLIKKEEDSDDEEGFDEFLDWRSKQS